MKRDSDATRARLLEAAITEFADHGIEAARLDRISAVAQANKQLIYRYFGDKRALFDAVIQKTMTDLAQAIEVTPDDIPGYLAAMRRYHTTHPYALRLLLWEALEQGADTTSNTAERKSHYDHKIKRVRDGQAAGLIRSDVGASDLTLALLGLSLWPQVVPQLTRLIAGEAPGSDRLHAATVALAQKMLTP